MTTLVLHETYGDNGNALFLECDACHVTTLVGQNLQKKPGVVAHACSGTIEKLKRRLPYGQDLGWTVCTRTSSPKVLTLPHKNTDNRFEINEFNFLELTTRKPNY